MRSTTKANRTGRKARQDRLARLDSLLPQRLDASESAFLLRQLEYVATRTYDVQYPLLYARKYIPINNTIDRAASSYTYSQYSQVGMAKLLASYADDLPRSDVYAKEFNSAIKPIGASYGYNIQEIRAAMRANIALDQKKSNAARRSVEVEVDRVLSTGDSAAGLNGFINQANALLFVVPNGGGGTPDWASKTALEILHDMVNICAFIPTSTGQVEQPDTLLLPKAQYTLISTTPYSQVASDLTILEYFKRNQPGVSVGMWPKLAGAGTGATDRMIAYERNPDKIEGIIPQEFEQFAPEQQGLSFQVACHARIGGVVAYYPLSMAVGDGI
jgi:hypothetical protein